MNYIICSHKITPEIEGNLAKSGLTPLKLRGVPKFGEFHPLNYHPDMFCFHLRDNAWIFYGSAYENNRAVLDGLGLDIIAASDPVSGEYPHYVGLNCAEAGRYLVCAAKHANAGILAHAAREKKALIDVKQGYARCSTCIAGDAIITADRDIYSKFPGNKLLIRAGHIDLWGYDYGFIGGCSGFFDSKLLFTGDIGLHPDYEEIRGFCGGIGIELISLSREKLRDYGGLIVI